MNGHPYDRLMSPPARRGVCGVQFFIGLFAALAVWTSWEFMGGWSALVILVPAGLLIGAVGQVARIAWLAGYSDGHRESLELWTKLPRLSPASVAAARITAGANIAAGCRVGLQYTRDGQRVIPLSQ